MKLPRSENRQNSPDITGILRNGKRAAGTKCSNTVHRRVSFLSSETDDIARTSLDTDCMAGEIGAWLGSTTCVWGKTPIRNIEDSGTVENCHDKEYHNQQHGLNKKISMRTDMKRQIFNHISAFGEVSFDALVEPFEKPKRRLHDKNHNLWYHCQRRERKHKTTKPNDEHQSVIDLTSKFSKGALDALLVSINDPKRRPSDLTTEKMASNSKKWQSKITIICDDDLNRNE
mmetsp:Transcript_1132/g.1946  ORF Transcript_1132/g.1946 Transcript_1132/m.1946 type:complete len:230 (-) Transcript_1132:38-727(-)|eukprot:CAMPEP_0196133552 /NCGR_PEP_ID=MMETSP0910-20130528/2732_1 /TAXON_ID=49265 /ORGANISM="Thalassiosira rotula, Strain GSO102" /LENGTH=229 /DNA_ID=CAMNT_0041393293 /DNA_START=55 /DNA_END=744 /DNA_ORIENTATION=+